MTSKKKKMDQLLNGVSWKEVASALGRSKSTVAKCAASMHKGRIDPERLKSMADPDVSGLFADGRGKRGEEHLGTIKTLPHFPTAP